MRISPIFMVCLAAAASPFLNAEEMELVGKESFEFGAEAWEPTDPKKWRVEEVEGGNHVYHLLGKSDYKPPHRSPHSISLLKDVVVGDFVLTAKVQTLQTPRAHRDMCLFFGYQDPAKFYYVHLGQKTDPHANQIFLVKDAPRVAISEKTNDGTPWQDNTWHKVKIVRKVESGLIEIYFDNMQEPQMITHNKDFAWGRIGLGSFDDFGLWDDVQLRGVRVEGK